MGITYTLGVPFKQLSQGCAPGLPRWARQPARSSAVHDMAPGPAVSRPFVTPGMPLVVGHAYMGTRFSMLQPPWLGLALEGWGWG